MAPKVEGLPFRIGSDAPESYSQGLMGGAGYDGRNSCTVLAGGFGGGGATFVIPLNGQWNFNWGCGGGYTGGSSRIRDGKFCDGGGGGSYSADPRASFDHKYELYGKCRIEFMH